MTYKAAPASGFRKSTTHQILRELRRAGKEEKVTFFQAAYALVIAGSIAAAVTAGTLETYCVHRDTKKDLAAIASFDQTRIGREQAMAAVDDLCKMDRFSIAISAVQGCKDEGFVTAAMSLIRRDELIGAGFYI